MSDKEINKEISYHSSCTAPSYGKGSEYWNGKKWTRKCPDYVNDLNAMHIAESTLSEADMFVMAYHIERIVSRNGQHYFHATARQRAEAFLRTFGKWKEEA